MPLSDQRRPSICLDVVYDIFLAVAGHQIPYQLCASTPEPTLRFRQDKINYVLEMTAEHGLSQHFDCNREKGNATTVATTVATFCSVTHLLVYKNNVGILPLLWETFSGPAVKDKIMQPSV